MKKSSWVHFSAIEGVTIEEDTFGIPEPSSDQFQGNPSDTFQRIPGHSFWDPYQSISTEESLGHSFQQQWGQRIHLGSRHINKGMIVGLSVTNTKSEAKVHYLGQFSIRSEVCSHEGAQSSSAIVVMWVVIVHNRPSNSHPIQQPSCIIHHVKTSNLNASKNS